MTLRATNIGRAVAASGLRPRTARYLLDYVLRHGAELERLLPDQNGKAERLDEFYALVIYACLCSPEFDLPASGGTRIPPYMLDRARLALPIRRDLSRHFADTPEANAGRVASTNLAIRWIKGEPSRDLEKEAEALTLGMLRSHFRDLAQVIAGLAALVFALVKDARADDAEPQLLKLAEFLARLPRLLRRTARRVEEGLPNEVLWMAEIESDSPDHRLSRADMLALYKNGIVSPIQAMDQNRKPERLKAFANAQPSPSAKENWFVQVVRQWKKKQRDRLAGRHRKRAARCPEPGLVSDYYEHREKMFEATLERVLEAIGIDFDKTDVPPKRGFADYILRIGNLQPIVLEVKSKTSEDLVGLNACTDVLRASELMGHAQARCVTLCHPGYDPSVPSGILNVARLCIVEAPHLAEALLRVCEGHLSLEDLHRWLTASGEALPADLPASPARRKSATSA